MDRSAILVALLVVAFLTMGWAAYSLARLVARPGPRPRDLGAPRRFTDRGRLVPFPLGKVVAWSAVFGIASACFWAAVNTLRISLAPEVGMWAVWLPIAAFVVLVMAPPLIHLRLVSAERPSMVWSSVSILLALLVPPLIALLGVVAFGAMAIQSALGGLD